MTTEISQTVYTRGEHPRYFRCVPVTINEMTVAKLGSGNFIVTATVRGDYDVSAVIEKDGNMLKSIIQSPYTLAREYDTTKSLIENVTDFFGNYIGFIHDGAYRNWEVDKIFYRHTDAAIFEKVPHSCDVIVVEWSGEARDHVNLHYVGGNLIKLYRFNIEAVGSTEHRIKYKHGEISVEYVHSGKPFPSLADLIAACSAVDKLHYSLLKQPLNMAEEVMSVAIEHQP